VEAGQGHALVGGHVHLELDARHLGQALQHLQALLAVHGSLLAGSGVAVSGLAMAS
jgi:hypothetical protein